MLMYHSKSKEPVDAHPSQIENMKAKGWTEKPISKTKPTKEVNDDGNA